MSYEQRDNSGTLFRNDSENEKAPDYKGKCMVNGQMMEMSAWIKQGKDSKFMSLAFQPPYQPDKPVDDFDDQDLGF